MTGSLDKFVIAAFITGDQRAAGAVAPTEILTKTALYYFYKRIWILIPWGKRPGIRRKAWDAVCSAASMRRLGRILQPGRTLMPAPHIVETKSRQTSPARPKLRCTWHLDPTSGRPVARWALEQSEPIRSVALRSAA
jgi:uncharacterized membrane protein